MPCYVPDEWDADLLPSLQLALRRRGRQLETVDSLIAAVTLRYSLILLTTDKDFQAVPGLPQENWLWPIDADSMSVQVVSDEHAGPSTWLSSVGTPRAGK